MNARRASQAGLREPIAGWSPPRWLFGAGVGAVRIGPVRWRSVAGRITVRRDTGGAIRTRPGSAAGQASEERRYGVRKCLAPVAHGFAGREWRGLEDSPRRWSRGPLPAAARHILHGHVDPGGSNDLPGPVRAARGSGVNEMVDGGE